MAVRPNILSICTGAGGLDLGVRLACPDARTVCYVEREAFAVANLVAAIQAGLMDDAPVWSDLATFDGRPWRGVVDWLIGGIPCQPHSSAGQKRGADDERDLWPDTARIIREIRPGIVFLENVPGIARYYHERIGPELRAMGYGTQEGLFSATEVGAPHERQRFFVLGYADSQGREGQGSRADRTCGCGPSFGASSARMADDDCQRCKQQDDTRSGRPEVGRCGSEVPDSFGKRWGEDEHGVHEGQSDFAGCRFPLAQMTSKPGHTCSQKCRRLNPLFVEWLMGWPGGWTQLPTGRIDSLSWETARSRWWRLMRSALSRLERGL